MDNEPENPTNDLGSEGLLEDLPEIEDKEVAEAALLPKIKAEMIELQATVQAFGLERLKDGTWFNEFLQTVMKPYGERVLKNGGVAYFRTKYPGVTRDALAQKICDTATKYAALAGGASAAISSAAFVATIGTAGGASVVMVPAGMVVILSETLWTIRLQMRLVFDLYLLQDYPIDLDDPEDMYKAFCLAYGIQFATDTVGGATKTLTPEAARSMLRNVIHGNTKLIQKMAGKVLGPKIGRKITEKALLRAFVPVVSIGISTGWNYLTTKTLGETVRQELRCLGRLRDAAGSLTPRLADDPETSAVVLEALMALINADGHLDLREQELFRHVAAFLEVPAATLERIEKHTDLDPTAVAVRLSQLSSPDVREATRDLLEVAAASDGRLKDSEGIVLSLFEEALGYEFDAPSVIARASNYQKDATRVGKAVQSAKKAAVDAGTFVAGTGKKLGGWAAGLMPRKPATPEPAEAHEGVREDPVALLEKLARLRDAGVLTDEEFSAKKAEILGRI